MNQTNFQEEFKVNLKVNNKTDIESELGLMAKGENPESARSVQKEPEKDTGKAGSAAPNEKVNRLMDGIFAWALSLFVFMLPIFIIPSPHVAPQIAKSFFVVSGAIVLLLLWMVVALIQRKITAPPPAIFIAAFLLLTVKFISSILSETPRVSLTGYALELDTFIFTAATVLTCLLAATGLKKESHVKLTLGALFSSFFVLSVFHIVRLLAGPAAFSFGYLVNDTSSLLAKWNDVAIFAGSIALFSLGAVILKTFTKAYRVAMSALFALSVMLLSMVNFQLAWLFTGIGAVIVGISPHIMSKSNAAESGEASTHPFIAYVMPLLIILISGFFIVYTDKVGDVLANRFNISQIEARPSFDGTLAVAKETLKNKPIFGIGPNRFGNAWQNFKPEGVNDTPFWAVDFPTGASVAATSAITGGLLGLFFFISFAGISLFAAIKLLYLGFSEKKIAPLVPVTALVVIYLWMFSILYVPGSAMMGMAFILTGVMLALGNIVAKEKISALLRTKEIVVQKSPGLEFAVVSLLTAIAIAGGVSGYAVLNQYAAGLAFQRGAYALGAEDNTEKARSEAEKAVRLSPAFDSPHRLLAQLHLNTLRAYIARAATDEKALQPLQETFGLGLESAKKAIAVRPDNYQNWSMLAAIYNSLVSFKVEGAYEKTKEAYAKAIEINPTNPSLYLSLARLEIAKGNASSTRAALEKSLSLKTNYRDALFLLSQIEVSEGNLDAALEAAEQVALLAPDSPLAFFQVGLLHYNKQNYGVAAAAFEKAVSLSNNYANALYFLGLAYHKLGRAEDAMQQFELVSQLNQDNQEVKKIMENLKAGLEPFSGIIPPPNSQKPLLEKPREDALETQASERPSAIKTE